MSLKASALKVNDSKRKAIKKEVTHILLYVDDEIKKAYDQDKHSVSVMLPIVFSLPHMSNSTAQRIIYYEVLINLLDREFLVEIDITPDKAIYEITWYSKEERDEINHQMVVLAKNTRKNPLNKDL